MLEPTVEELLATRREELDREWTDAADTYLGRLTPEQLLQLYDNVDRFIDWMETDAPRGKAVLLRLAVY